MPVSADLNKLLDKAYENTDLKSLANAPVDAIAGVSESDAEALRNSLGIKTIGDMGRNKYFRAAQAIADLAESSR